MKRLLYSSILCWFSLTAMAIPAHRGGIKVIQSDGSEITVYQHGDEHFHWTTNAQGEWIQCGEDGLYRVIPALSDEEIQVRRAKSPRRIPQQVQTASPLNIAPRGLVILVNFSDKAFTATQAEMDSMLNGKDYSRSYSYTYNGKKINISAQGSARRYFQDASFGQYNPQFDVIGPVTLSHTVSYYGSNDDAKAGDMVKEACQLADSQFGVNFANYDNNNDGTVDFVYIFYAGYGEADSDIESTIWPHTYWLKSGYGITLKLDNKYIDSYACSNEIDYSSKQHDGIGTFCHEFSHVLGLPDLYITNTELSSFHRTLDTWDIMDYGPYNNNGNTPPAYSAYERFFMGWLTPRLLVNPENVVLEDINSSEEALLISATDTHNLVGNDPSSNTFYLLENRQQKGWDSHLEGHGMMLTKINYSYTKWYNNIVNNTANSMGVDLIEADGIAPAYSYTTPDNGYFAKEGDLFPAGATSYNGISGHAITDINESAGVITFRYKGGATTGLEEPSNLSEEEVIGIYTLTGQQVPFSNRLPHGTYIIRTENGCRKVIR